MSKRYNIAKRILIFWTLFIGLGAIGGSLCMFIDPTGKMMGMDGMLPFFQVLPFANVLFQNLIFSGVMLLIVNGLTNILASILLFFNKKSGIILGTIFGFTLMLWIIIQFVIFPFNFMSTAFFIFGFLQLVTGYVCFVGYQQSQFKFDENQYKNIGNDKSKVVVYFSRMGYTKKLAYEIANEKGADIVEIKTTEKVDGNLGFWWCGRYGMHKWGMPLEPNEIDFFKYEEVTICSPVWVFGVCAPIRQFCIDNANKLNNVSYLLTHFMNCKFENIALDMDRLLCTTHKELLSYRCRFGNTKRLK